MKRLKVVYLAFRISSAELEAVVRGFRALNIIGFNVTVPHKVAIQTHLDILEETAQLAGAVNTVVNQGGDLVGHNTDIEGVAYALRRHHVNAHGSKALIFGAGGAARACIVALAQGGCEKFVIVNRSQERARKLVREMERKLGMEGQTIMPADPSLNSITHSCDIIVNATPVGSSLEPGKTLLDSSCLDGEKVVFDLVYKPVETPLLKSASMAGAIVIPGYEMLVGQGASSFKLWTRVEPPIDAMERAVLNFLRGVKP